MSNKNSSVIKLIGNKLFIALLVFAIGIIMVSAFFGRKSEKVVDIEPESDKIPVISENSTEKAEYTEPELKNTEPVIAESKKEEKVEDVEYNMPLTGELQKRFSVSDLLWDETMQDWRTHNGIDIAAYVGAEVDTAAAGTVTEAYQDEKYGFVVKVQHQDGVITVYKNLEKIVVEKDDVLDQGQMIGTVGNKGAFEIARKPHLHFEVIVEDKNTDPLEFIK